MSAAATRPWYLPTCVNGQIPVTSPIAQTAAPGPPPGANQQLVSAKLRAILEGQRVALPAPLRRARLDPESQLDPLRAQGLGQSIAQGRRLVRQRAGLSLGDRHGRAQAREGLAALHTDRPAAGAER